MTKFVQFTRRTNFPKLGYLIQLLTARGIPCRLNGESFHAPILEVSELFEEDAWTILAAPARKTYDLPVRFGVSLDDVPDEHACFAKFLVSEEDSEEDSEEAWYAELNKGYAQDRI